MKKKKIFISSVQAEFKKERVLLFDYITNDPLLGRFFEPFIFENLPAADTSASDAYIKNVEESDIYLGIFGKDYGYEDKEGISPTEREFDPAKLTADNSKILKELDWKPKHLDLDFICKTAYLWEKKISGR
ncbi:MAG: DUF4062 domain-containing protein [bacterium]